MTTNQISNSEISSNSNPQYIFSFLNKTELTLEEFEKNMKDLISLSLSNEGNLAQLFAIKKESILSMMDLAVKHNDGILFIKFIINLSNIKDKLISNDINIPDLLLIYFKKICLNIESNSSQKDSPIEKIIKDYEEILLLASDYFSKILNFDSNMNYFGKYIEKVSKENIYTFYVVFSIILYNLCKNSSNVNIKQFIDLLRLNQIPISSSGINSYIDLLCRLNLLEDCQTFFEDIISYKPALEIPNKVEKPIQESNNDNIINDNKIIYDKHMSSFGINIISFGIFLKYLCKNDHLDLALLYFDQMISKKMLKDEIIFNLILNGCGKKGDFKNLYRVYEEMLNNGIEPTNITMNTLIDAFIRNDEIDKAWNIFEKMFKNQITPDNFTLSTLFRGIKTQEHFDYLMKGINLVKERADKIDIILINVLLDACTKLKDSKDFLELFDNLMNGKFSNNNTDNASNENNNVIKPDLITYNTFIKGCTQMKLYDKIDYVFEHLINKNDLNITPNDVTFNSLIDAYMRQNNMNKVFLLLSQMQQYHIKPDNFTYTTIIKGLNKDSFSSNKNNQNNKNSEIDLAFQLFEKVKQISKPDEILYNCIMDACLRFNQVDKMLELYKEMIENGINCSSVTYGIVIKAYGMKGDVDSALQMYEKMKLNKVKISSVTYGCLINVCTKNNKLSKAFELYELLNKEGIEMNTILYTTMIKAYSKTKNLNKVIEILNTMINSKSAKPNIITYNCVIDCCIKCDNFKLAYQYFNYLVEINKNLLKNSKQEKNSNNTYENLRLDIVTFSTLIKGELHKHNFGNARSLMNKMMEFDYIKLDCILLNTLLDGCEKCECHHEALDIFYLFKKKKVEVNMMTYSILLKILGVLNDFENSYKLFEEMKADKNISMNLIIITCFIKTCLSNGHIKQAIETFNSIKSYHLKPDTISYITMINGIMKNYYENNIEFTKEIIYLVKESINDGITFQYNFYMKIINYVKNNSPELSEEFIKYLNSKKVFEYQYKDNKNKIYNYNDSNNKNYINNDNYADEKENDKDMNNYKGKYNNFLYDKKRKPLRQIYKANYNENNYYNGQNNNNWKKNNYKNNNRFNNNESNYGYNNYNDYGEKEGNYRWKNNYNKEKNYLNKKSGNNFYQ